jgi:hypothetical protein
MLREIRRNEEKMNQIARKASNNREKQPSQPSTEEETRPPAVAVA